MPSTSVTTGLYKLCAADCTKRHGKQDIDNFADSGLNALKHQSLQCCQMGLVQATSWRVEATITSHHAKQLAKDSLDTIHLSMQDCQSYRIKQLKDR